MVQDPPASPEAAADRRAWLGERADTVERGLSEELNRLKALGTANSRLLEAVEYSLQAGGKRIRPVLVLECCRVSGGREEDAMPAALAVECVHTFSLIHDDLPAMDDDELRRGRPTNHRVFGEAMAILAGDWLVAHAFALCGQAAPDRVAGLVAALSNGTKSMVVGQGADIAGESEETDPERVQFIHMHKTAALIAASTRMGAVAADAGPEAEERMERFGRHLGLAFQITDDLLDATGTTVTLGKRAGKDASVAKQTWPAAYGIEASRAEARREIEAAIELLEPYGQRADGLRGLATFILSRDR